MIRVVTRFQKVKFQTHRTGTCPVCGKRWKKSKTFTQTINPGSAPLARGNQSG